MFKRRMQYNQGSGFQMTPAGGVYMPSVQNTVEGANYVGSLIGSAASAVAEQMANPAVLAASQGVASNMIPSTVDPATLPDYQVAPPRPVDYVTPGGSYAMNMQRISSGVGAHPGGAGRGKGAGGSLGQEARQAKKSKRLSKRIANRKTKGKDQIQLSSDAPKTRDDYDYAEGGRVEKASGGIISKVASKILKELGEGGRSFSKKERKRRSELNKELFELRKKDVSPEEVDELQRIKMKIEYIDDELGGVGGDTMTAQELSILSDEDLINVSRYTADNPWDEVDYYQELMRDRKFLMKELKDISKEKKGRSFVEMDEEIPFAEGGRVEKAFGGAAMTNKNTWAKTPIEKRKMYQEGGNMDSQITDMMEGPTHTMPDGTVMPGATHGEYEQGLAEGQAEDMSQEGMVPDAQMEEDFVDYVVESTLEPEDTMYLEEALAADPRLSEIFDQVIETASEFSGSGPVEGPGSEVSDSIPARLSDGEFVITSKATEEIGPDNLQGMMEQAEMDSDVRREAAEGGYMINEDVEMDDPIQPRVDPTEREMRKLQLASNPRSQYRTVYG